ncbi:MAG: 16S rRNA (cytosine(967)-C(5))-methyltransferase RsmB [Myxococcales bacterium]|nr:16S rRNA (cytosine(967)-C(5))-methyltransferase RsmB [Myxococcales bacterium]MDH5305693.1 16S rRNA (cytosine(967)-C(5))-methyltransferase RsmB [Myxococcales bacterium]MDH5568151.1 16S rRNA (cytosine(967)-C(5))-methyltransferase RsmB [Myxococcales bacterium]
MSAPKQRRARPNRGRPHTARGAALRRSPAPTRTRLLALRVLERVQRAGAYADVLLHSTLARSPLNAPDRAFATELVYGTLRWRGRIDFMLSRCVERDLDKLEPLVATALRLGAYQILFAENVPASAAVDEAVRCVRACGTERATGLVNAVLRRLAAQHQQIALPALADDPLGNLIHALSMPMWIAARWIEAYGPEEAAALAAACNQAPPLSVRVNPHQGTRAELLEELRPRFPDARPCAYARAGLVLGRRGNPALDRAFLAGRFTVQDEAAQLVVDLLDPQPGERVLDVCAAPGGKTTAIAERVGRTGSVLALDRNARRLELVRRSARRLQLDRIECAVRDATQSFGHLVEERGFDRVLVDAPCSGLGTLRRNPDARWRVRSSDPARLAEIQIAILRNAAATLGAGGVLVYSTCTLTREENEGVIEAFLRSATSFVLASRLEAPFEVRELVAEDGFMRCLPHRHDTDGFFAARLEKRG